MPGLDDAAWEAADVKRALHAILAAAFGLTVLAGCGDDGARAAGGYCEDLKAAMDEIDAVQHGELAGLGEVTGRLHELADEAPEEIEDDWEILLEGVDKLVEAIEDAGLSEADLAGLQTGQIPDGVDIAALQDLMAELQELSTPEFQKASDNIAKHAKDKCGVDLET